MATKKKLTWLKAVEKVLDDADEPLHSDEIARRAI